MQLHSAQSLFDVHGISGHPVPKCRRLRSSWPVRGLLTIVRWISAERHRRRAVRELQSFDDRMLRDIGITRAEIKATVRYARAQSLDI